MKKIDWSNHIISFFSALLGILIAFRLEFFREEHQEKEQLDKALLVIKEELESNLNIYKTNSDQLCAWMSYYNSVVDTFSTGDNLEINVGAIQGISASAWQSAINSGIVAQMEHDDVFKLTSIYDWTSRDLGVSDSKMIEDHLDGGYDNIDVIVDHYERVCKVHTLKYEQINPLFEQIDWKSKKPGR